MGPRHVLGAFSEGSLATGDHPRGRPHAEPSPNEGRWQQRDRDAWNGRQGARKSFLGAERKARSRQAEANGQAASTLKSCLVQPHG
jgi:hypothetical protein